MISYTRGTPNTQMANWLRITDLQDHFGGPVVSELFPLMSDVLRNEKL